MKNYFTITNQTKEGLQFVPLQRFKKGNISESKENTVCKRLEDLMKKTIKLYPNN